MTGESRIARSRRFRRGGGGGGGGGFGGDSRDSGGDFAPAGFIYQQDSYIYNQLILDFPFDVCLRYSLLIISLLSTQILSRKTENCSDKYDDW